MRRVLGAVAIAAVVLGGTSACAQPTPAFVLKMQRQEAERARWQAEAPAGYRDLDRGIAYRWDDGTCLSAEGTCRIIHLYAYEPCTGGYLEGELRDRRGRAAGIVSGTIALQQAGDRGDLTVVWSEPDAVDVHLTSLECG